VTADDIQRVAKRYFLPDNRAVALFFTKKSEGGEEDALLAGLDEQERAQVRQFQGMLGKMTADQASAALQQIEQQESSAPPEKKQLLQSIKKLLQEKIRSGGK
jgi:hypothetical protein